MKRNSGIIGPETVSTRVDGANGVFDIHDNYNYRLINEWPLTKKHSTPVITPSTTIAEGTTCTCTVPTEGYEDGELLYYTIYTSVGPAMTGADFTDGLIQGSFEVNSNQGVLTKILMPSDGTENNQFYFQIRINSVSGDIVINSPTITVTDESAPTGQVNFLTPGTYSWTVAAGVTSVSVLCIGGGGGGIAYACCQYSMSGGGGGGLGWKNNISVSPGNYTVVVGAAGNAGNYSTGNSDGGDSYFINNTTVKGGGGDRGLYYYSVFGGDYVGDGGGNGGGALTTNVYNGPISGGGGGGYSGAGGNGRQTIYTSGLTVPTGGGGGGGCGTGQTNYTRAWGGGGVGIYGEGASGATSSSSHPGGYGGSGGDDGIQGSSGAQWGGNYGGGGGGSTDGYYPETSGDGAGGAVRIIWGTGRAYPSTLTQDL